MFSFIQENLHDHSFQPDVFNWYNVLGQEIPEKATSTWGR